jgi:hypothetical protein
MAKIIGGVSMAILAPKAQSGSNEIDFTLLVIHWFLFYFILIINLSFLLFGASHRMPWDKIPQLHRPYLEMG